MYVMSSALGDPPNDCGKLFKTAREEIVQALERMLSGGNQVELEPALRMEVINRLNPQINEVCAYVEEAFFNAFKSQLLPAAREMRDSVRHEAATAAAAAAEHDAAASGAAGMPSNIVPTDSETMIDCLPHGLLDQTSGNFAHLLGNQAPIPQGLPPRCRSSSSSGVAPHAANSEHVINSRMPLSSDDGGPHEGGGGYSSAGGGGVHQSGGSGYGQRMLSPMPRSHTDSGAPTPGAPLTAPSSCSAASHASSQGPSSRAPSPAMTTPAMASEMASHMMSTPPSWPSNFGHMPTPQQLFGAGGSNSGNVQPSSYGSPASATPTLSAAVGGKPQGSVDDSYHAFGASLDNVGLGGFSSFSGGPPQLRSASFAGDSRPPRLGDHPAAANMRQLPFPLSALGLRQQQQLAQQDAGGGGGGGNYNSAPLHPPQQHQPLQPREAGGGILSDSLLAQLLAMDSQAHGAVQLSSAFPHVPNAGSGGGANLNGFDNNQMACLAELLAASRGGGGGDTQFSKSQSGFLSAADTPDGVSRANSYAGQTNFMSAGGAPQQMTPAAAMAAAGSLSLQQQQHLAMCGAKLQALQLQQHLHNQQQQQLLQQQPLLQPPPQQQQQQQQLQFQQQLEAAAQRQQMAAALSGGGGRAFLDQHLLVAQGLGSGGGGAPAFAPQMLEIMPKRLQVLPVSVQHKILEVVTKLPVLQLNDFDEKVVYKLSLLLDQFGAGECINMLGHLMERIRKKDKSMMRNGPGYLDVAVSTHIDEMKALEKGAGVINMPLDEYARQMLPVQLFEELREAVDSNRWLRWEDLDQGIVNVLKKMPRESAQEKLQELTYHSFKNVDNTKGCIMSILNGRGDKWWARTRQ